MLHKEIRAVLDAQAEAWNRGDLSGYMDGYERSGDLTFAGGGEVTRGWQATLDRYRKRYDTKEKMGRLRFSDLEIIPLAEDAAFVLGRWELEREKDRPHGVFTVIFRRGPSGWRVVHDHSSSAP